MDSVNIDIAGVRQVGIRFDEFPDALYADLRAEIDALSIELYARVQAMTPMRLGTLQSQERLRLFTDKSRITGYIDIAGSGRQDYIKAGALEYGAHRPAQVDAYAMQLDHFWADKLAAPITVMHKASTRPTDIAEHAFERGPLAAMQPEVLARLNAVVTNAVAKANS